MKTRILYLGLIITAILAIFLIWGTCGNVYAQGAFNYPEIDPPEDDMALWVTDTSGALADFHVKMAALKSYGLGHVIIDENGAVVTQRDSLEFSGGVTVTDESTGAARTRVNVHAQTTIDGQSGTITGLTLTNPLTLSSTYLRHLPFEDATVTGSTTLDLTASNVFSLTVTGDVTLENPTVPTDEDTDFTIIWKNAGTHQVTSWASKWYDQSRISEGANLYSRWDCTYQHTEDIVFCESSANAEAIVKDMVWDAGAFSADGTNCADPTEQTIGSWGKQWTIVCTDNDASVITGKTIMPDGWNAGTLTFELNVIQDAADTGALNADVSARCVGSGETPVAYGTEVALDIASLTGSDARDDVTSAAVTPAGTCAAGDLLQFQIAIDATGTTTAMATMHIVGAKAEYTTNITHE